jgi:hypothetical protein
MDLIQSCAHIPEVLVEVHYELCQRDVFSNGDLIDEVEAKFKAARMADIEYELSELKRTREEFEVEHDEDFLEIEEEEGSLEDLVPVIQPPVTNSGRAPPPKDPKDFAAILRWIRHARKPEHSDFSVSIDWNFREQSALKHLGYTVGATNGMSQKQRRDFLDDFLIVPLPTSLPPEYRSEWGAPGSAMRLQRTAEQIASNARISPDHAPAA